VTRRLDLERHRRSLGEIQEIMNSMKTLAYMETRKLARFLDAQQAVVESIETVAADFLGFHPDTLPEVAEAPPVYLLIGSERGFCGDFNHALLRHLQATLNMQTGGKPLLIAVGRKLQTLLERDARVAARIEGASVVEEAPAVLNRMLYELSSLQQRGGMLTVHALFHSSDQGVVLRKMLPPFRKQLAQPASHRHPPLLQLPPAEFLGKLAEQYLFAALHAMLYASLMTENHTRVTHLEGAVRQLQDESAELTRRCNSLRQEEIIEEIEVILLSACSVDQGRRACGSESADGATAAGNGG
jgi:F-type H+-transporting ATPase subunit gamma